MPQLHMTFKSITPNILFCSQCGHAVEHSTPAGDTKIRAVCPACSAIHYENPKCVVCSICVLDGKILLCLRDIEPQAGLWTVPGGFLECDETLAQGAIRETAEEACAQVELIEPAHTLIDIPHIAQIHVFFRANIIAQNNQPALAAGHETRAVKLFAPDEIPWDDLAFNSVRYALKQFIADSEIGHFTTRHHTLEPKS